MRGKRYETEKKIWGGDRKSEDAIKSTYQNDKMIIPRVPKMRTRKEHYIHYDKKQCYQNDNIDSNLKDSAKANERKDTAS